MLKKFAYALFLLTPVSLLANEPADWQLGFQTPASDVMRNVYDLHNFVLIMMTAITIFVLFLIFYVVFRFRRKVNPSWLSKTTHTHL